MTISTQSRPGRKQRPQGQSIRYRNLVIHLASGQSVSYDRLYGLLQEFAITLQELQDDVLRHESGFPLGDEDPVASA